MVAYSFKRFLVEPIRSGRKPHTIRADRKRHARPGETLQLYTGMRTKACMLIGTATCSDVQPITLDFVGETIKIGHRRPIRRRSRGPDRYAELDAFAWSDGFENWPALFRFWGQEHAAIARWSGVIIFWIDFKMPEASAQP